MTDFFKKNYDVLVPIFQAIAQLESGGMAKYASSLVNDGQVWSPTRWPLILEGIGKDSKRVYAMQDTDISFADVAYVVKLLGWAFNYRNDRSTDAAQKALPAKPREGSDLLDKITAAVVDLGLWPTADLRNKTVDYTYYDIELTVRAMLSGMLMHVPGDGGGNPYSLPPGGG